MKPSTNPHAHRLAPAPLRKAGLHAITSTTPGGAMTIKGKTPVYTVARIESRIAPAGDAPICNGAMGGDPYPCPELAPSGRPGAMDAYRLPSGGYEEQAARARVAARREAEAPTGQMIPLRRVA